MKKTTKELAHSKTPKKTSSGWWVFLNIVGMMVWVSASVIVAQLVVGYLMIWILGKETFSQPVATAIYSALSYILAFLLIVFVPLAIRHKAKDKKYEVVGREEIGLNGLPTWTDIGLAPVGFIVYLLLAAGITAIFSSFPWFDAEQVQDVGFSTYIAGFDRVVAFITLVVMAPVAEELIFRGWLYGKMRNKLNVVVSNTTSMIITIFLVSLLFGIVHMQWNVGVNVFALSIVLCGLREITGTIYSGIILHMIKNGVAFYLLYVAGIR